MWKRGYMRVFLFLNMFIGLVIGLMVWSLGGSQAQADRVIYGDSLERNWENWSWDTTVNFTQSEFKNSGSTTISAIYTQSQAGLYLHSTVDIDTSPYDTLRFNIHGGAKGNHTLKVLLTDTEDNLIESPVAVTSSAGIWTPIEIPLVNLLAGQTLIRGIVWQSSASSVQPVFYIDDISLLISDRKLPPATLPTTGLVLTINAAMDQHPIDPNIYGLNFADAALAADLNLPVNRWGGKAATRYNWQLDATNQGSDGFFMNTPYDNTYPNLLPDDSASDKFIEANQATATQSILTVPLIGWSARSRDRDCGFSAAQYPDQQQFDDVWSCGNGLLPDGTPITGSDPLATSLAVDETFVSSWVAHVVSRYGSADNGGVRFYNLDNEPMMWHRTHRDVHPQPLSYDQLRDLTYRYAAAVKRVDPEAKILGPVAWGWTDYFYSALDQAAGDNWWQNPPDRNAHGGVPLVEWYLWQMQQYEMKNGLRLIDYLDLHYYPQADGVALSEVGDADTQARRLRSTRALWDPTYIDESWISEPVRLIPRMRAWVDTHYPGTKLAISEYNWGALDHINGALAQADILGIFGREGLDLATLWSPPAFDEPGAFAFRIYRNYDGSGGSFGDWSVKADSSDQAKLAIYAARRSSDDYLTVVVINKSSRQLTGSINLSGYTPAPQAAVYCYAADDLSQIVRWPDQDVSAEFSTDFPPESITLFELSPGSLQPLADDIEQPILR